jgi:hypothetical protein
MSEKVLYIRWPKKTEYAVLPRISTNPLPIIPTDYFYLNERGFTVYGNVNLLNCTLDLSEVEPGKKIIPTLDVTKDGLKEIRSSCWQIIKLKMPTLWNEEAIKELMIQSKEIDRVMKADREHEKALKAMSKELEEYKKNNPNLPEHYIWTPKTNPFDYARKFSKVCDEVFGPYIEGQ